MAEPVMVRLIEAFSGSSEVMSMVPVNGPEAGGLKVMVMSWDWPGGTVNWVSERVMPAMSDWMSVMLSGPVPLFVMVNVVVTSLPTSISPRLKFS